VVTQLAQRMEIRGARAGDAPDIARLVLLSAPHFLPAVFGPGIARALEGLAAGQGTLFGHEHALMAEEEGGVRGMLLGYAGQAKGAQDLRTGLALLLLLRSDMVRRLPALLKSQSAVGRIRRDEYYISNVAVYPEHRGRGIGALLVARARDEAGRAGASRMVLDVETDNPDAQRLYQRLGFAVVSETPPLVVAGHAFAFRRMAMPLFPL